jgi:hypothetical protein
MKWLTILLFSIIIGIVSCRDDRKEPHLISTQELMIDSLPGECPYLTKDNKGNIILSWVRMINDSTTAFCYARSKDGKSFGHPIIVPGSNNIQPHGENLPKIIFKPSGEIICLWGVANPNPKNKYSGLVFYVQSFDEGNTWTSPRPLVSDTASYDQRYYDIALLPDGEAGIIWLDNRKTTSLEGSGLHFALTKGKIGFLNDRLISQPCCQCCRTDLFVDTKGNIHILYRGIIKDSIRDMIHIASSDGGGDFSKPVRISDDDWVINGCPHTGPAMTENKNGLQFAWFTGGKNKGCFYASSKDNGASFTPRSAISEFGSHPQLASLKDNEVVIVWDETTQTDKNYYKRIGIQKRNGEGISSGKYFITPDTLISTYPVLAVVGEDSVLVAYTTKKQNKNYVMYQSVSYR